MNYEPVYRTAPATPGLLSLMFNYFPVCKAVEISQVSDLALGEMAQIETYIHKHNPTRGHVGKRKQ